MIKKNKGMQRRNIKAKKQERKETCKNAKNKQKYNDENSKRIAYLKKAKRTTAEQDNYVFRMNLKKEWS